MKTPEELVQDFINGILYIGIRGASVDDMKVLQGIVGRRWRTGDDLDCQKHTYLTALHHDYYIHNNTFMYGKDTLSATSDPPKNCITIAQFLSLFDLSIEESEVEKMFED